MVNETKKASWAGTPCSMCDINPCGNFIIPVCEHCRDILISKMIAKDQANRRKGIISGGDVV